MNYQRLIDERNRLDCIYEESKRPGAKDCPYVNALEMEYGIDSFFGEGGRSNYEFIRDFMLERGLKKLFDIGCAEGYQSECFVDTDITYVGMDAIDTPFWNRDRYEYRVGVYPKVSIPDAEESLAVSVLCLTWLCYGHNTCEDQMAQLAKDFKQALLLVNSSALDIVKKYWATVEPVQSRATNSLGGFYYLSNEWSVV